MVLYTLRHYHLHILGMSPSLPYFSNPAHLVFMLLSYVLKHIAKYFIGKIS
jgi:hypothetical protein